MSLIPIRPEPVHSLAAVGLDPTAGLFARAGIAEVNVAAIARQAHETRNAAIGRAFGDLGRWFARQVIGRLKAARERRRAIAELSRMDDLALHDLGLTRSGIYAAVSAQDDIRHAVANENAPPRRPARAA